MIYTIKWKIIYSIINIPNEYLKPLGTGITFYPLAFADTGNFRYSRMSIPSGQLSGLKFVIFISHKRSRVWTRYFTRLCVIISSTCVIFFVNLDDFFIVICTSFYQNCGFHQICSLKEASESLALLDISTDPNTI